MASIEEYDEKIQGQLEKLQQQIEKLSKMDGNKRVIAIKQCQLQLKDINNNLEAYDFEISQLDRHKEQIYKQSLGALQKKYQILKTDLNIKINEGKQTEQLFEGRKEQLEKQDNPALMNQDQLIQYGHQVQDKGLQKLNEIENLMQQDIELADQINQELDRQIEKLDQIKVQVMDTKTALNRTFQYIKYFSKQVQNDKILICLICTIVLVIIVLIILSATGVDDGKFNVPDFIKKKK